MLSNTLNQFTRRLFTGGPTSIPAEASVAWREELLRSAPVGQPYAGPLTTGDNLTGETPTIRDRYPSLLKESTVKAALGKKVLAVAQLDLQVAPDPSDPDDPTHNAAAEWVRYAIMNARGGTLRIVWDVAMPALLSGWSVAEKVWDRVDTRHKKYPGFWTLKALKSKLNVGANPGIRLRIDEYKNVVGVRSMVAGMGGHEFPPSEFVHHVYWPLFESPWGISDLRAAYRDADFLDAAIKLRQILLENFSGPFLRGKYRAGDKATEAQLRRVLTDARARGFVTYPEGSEVDVINLATSAPDQFNATVENLSKRIFLAINGAYLDSLESSTTQGDSEVAGDVAQLFVWYLASDVAATLTEQLVPDLVEPNYGIAGGRPVITFGGVDTGFILKQLDRLQKAGQVGLDVSKRQAYELTGLEPPVDEQDKLTPQPSQPGLMFWDGKGGAPTSGATFRVR